MDGYAVRAADVAGASEEFPAALTVIGDVAAGSGELPDVGPGQAARIMTGAPLPPGAEAVVPVEWTDGGTGEGPATGDARPAARPRRAPAARSGSTARPRPAPMSAPAAATSRPASSPWRRARSSARRRSACSPPSAAAPCGCAPARASSCCPPAANWSSPARNWASGQIYDSNSFALTAAARDAGAIAYRVGAVADDAETLRSTIEDQLIRADLLVTTGGVSVGAYDVVKEALSPRSATRTSRAAGSTSASSPCSPASPRASAPSAPTTPRCSPCPATRCRSYVSFELFVRPAIRALMGLQDVHRPTTARRRCTADKALTSPKGRRQFLRGAYDADGGHGHPGRRRRIPPDRGPRARRRADRRPRGRRRRSSPGAEVEVVLLG